MGDDLRFGSAPGFGIDSNETDRDSRAWCARFEPSSAISVAVTPGLDSDERRVLLSRRSWHGGALSQGLQVGRLSHSGLFVTRRTSDPSAFMM